MTAQHAPHTPPLWRKFLSLPQTGIGWWAIGLTVGSALLLIFGGISGVVADPVLVMMIFIAGLLAGAVVGLIALLRSQQERSVSYGLLWCLWRSWQLCPSPSWPRDCAMKLDTICQ